jgi:hypothetical protein
MPSSFEWELAKRILEPLIYSGEISDSMGPRDIYNHHEHKDVSKKVNYVDFRNNHHNLRKAIRKLGVQSAVDQHAFDFDRALHPVDKTKLRWPDSKAESALWEDVRQGKHKAMKPAQLHQTNESYKEWPFDRFWDQIYQERSRDIVIPYCAGV